MQSNLVMRKTKAAQRNYHRSEGSTARVGSAGQDRGTSTSSFSLLLRDSKRECLHVLTNAQAHEKLIKPRMRYIDELGPPSPSDMEVFEDSEPEVKPARVLEREVDFDTCDIDPRHLVECPQDAVGESWCHELSINACGSGLQTMSNGSVCFRNAEKKPQKRKRGDW